MIDLIRMRPGEAAGSTAAEYSNHSDRHRPEASLQGCSATGTTLIDRST
jgi:hypothetical protein